MAFLHLKNRWRFFRGAELYVLEYVRLKNQNYIAYQYVILSWPFTFVWFGHLIRNMLEIRLSYIVQNLDFSLTNPFFTQERP